MDIREMAVETVAEETSVSKSEYDDVFKRWVLVLAELTACAVLSLLGTVKIYHVFSGIEHEGGKAETVNVLSMLGDTAWETVFFAVLFVFLASVMLFGAALFVKRMRTAGMLAWTMTATVLFTGCQAAGMYGIITAYAQKTIGGIPYETGLTEVGVIYFIVSAFAVLELVLAWRVVRKQRREANAPCGESM